MPLISRLEFGSYLRYTPRPENIEQGKSKNLMYALKNDRKAGSPPELFSAFIARNLKEHLNRLPFKSFFGPEVLLVPVPRSGRMKGGELWVPLRLVRELERNGLGKEFDCLERVKSVNKSATSSNESRPKAKDHCDSIECRRTLNFPENIVLVDDMVTRGATLLGCASKMHEVYPQATIRAFAVMRPASNTEDFQGIEDPCVGFITLSGEETFRNP